MARNSLFLNAFCKKNVFFLKIKLWLITDHWIYIYIFWYITRSDWSPVIGNNGTYLSEIISLKFWEDIMANKNQTHNPLNLTPLNNLLQRHRLSELINLNSTQSNTKTIFKKSTKNPPSEDEAQKHLPLQLQLVRS